MHRVNFATMTTQWATYGKYLCEILVASQDKGVPFACVQSKCKRHCTQSCTWNKTSQPSRTAMLGLFGHLSLPQK